MRWATRAGCHVDRAACAWLIRREVDPNASFCFVDDPDEVSVEQFESEDGSVVLELCVGPDDYGKVIGRGGRTATAFRTVISSLAGRGGARIDFVDVDRRR